MDKQIASYLYNEMQLSRKNIDTTKWDRHNMNKICFPEWQKPDLKGYRTGYHFCDILEKTKVLKQKVDRWFPGTMSERMGYAEKEQWERILGSNETCFVCICQNLQNHDRVIYLRKMHLKNERLDYREWKLIMVLIQKELWESRQEMGHELELWRWRAVSSVCFQSLTERLCNDSKCWIEREQSCNN